MTTIQTTITVPDGLVLDVTEYVAENGPTAADIDGHWGFAPKAGAGWTGEPETGALWLNGTLPDVLQELADHTADVDDNAAEWVLLP